MPIRVSQARISSWANSAISSGLGQVEGDVGNRHQLLEHPALHSRRLPDAVDEQHARVEPRRVSAGEAVEGVVVAGAPRAELLEEIGNLLHFLAGVSLGERLWLDVRLAELLE